MALIILARRRCVSYSTMRCDPITKQNIKRIGTWYQFRFRVVKTIDGANIGLTCSLSQKLIDALNSYGQLLLNKDIAVLIVFVYHHFANKKSAGSNKLCHDTFIKLKTVKHHSKGDKIHFGWGVTYSTKTLSRHSRLLYISAHILTFIQVYHMYWNLWEIYRLLEKLQGIICCQKGYCCKL